MSLLQQAQEIFKINTKWNKIIGLIKEINIEKYHQKDFRDIVDSIVHEVWKEDN